MQCEGVAFCSFANKEAHLWEEGVAVLEIEVCVYVRRQEWKALLPKLDEP